MALIKCPECGKEVSDKAQTCINCGCPIIEQKNEVVTNTPSTVTIVENHQTNAQKKFFISLVLNVIGTAIPTFFLLSVCVQQGISNDDYQYFLSLVPLVIAFVFSLLTYLIKNDKRKKLATGSIIFSIISCIFCIIIASADGCALLLLIPSGVLFIVSALMTVLGMKEYLNK